VDTFYEGCDVLLFTSTEWEAFGLVPLEAMAHGVPVVATPVGELPYLLRDVEGVIVDAEPRLMADAVLALLESPEKYTTASERCLSRAGVYNVKRMVADYAALYDCLVGGHAFPELPSRG
jgi:glycosyltransferase involved in cell wall biosynthesis